MKVGQLVKVIKGPLEGSLAYILGFTNDSYQVAESLDSSKAIWVLKEYVEAPK